MPLIPDGDAKGQTLYEKTVEGKFLLGAGRTLSGVKKSCFDTDKGYDASFCRAGTMNLVYEKANEMEHRGLVQSVEQESSHKKLPACQSL